MANNFLMTEWAKDKKEVWERVVAKYGGNPKAFDWGTWDFFDWAIGKAWLTIGSVSKARRLGWSRYDDTYDAWIQTFRAFENAGVLPLPEFHITGKAHQTTAQIHSKAEVASGSNHIDGATESAKEDGI